MNSTFVDNNTLLNRSDISVSESESDIEHDDNNQIADDDVIDNPRKKLRTISDVDKSQSSDEEGSSDTSDITLDGVGVSLDNARERGGVRGRGGARAARQLPPQHNLTWEKIVDDDNKQQLHDFPFIDNEGLKVRLRDNPNHLDFVDLYLTDAVINLMVEETSRFANQFFQGDIDPENTYLGQWEPVTFLEMKKFIGVMLLMGIIYKPSLYLYWSTDILLFNTSILANYEKR